MLGLQVRARAERLCSDVGFAIVVRTLVATVSLPSLIIALLMPCSVVVYVLSEVLACSKESWPLQY